MEEKEQDKEEEEQDKSRRTRKRRTRKRWRRRKGHTRETRGRRMRGSSGKNRCQRQEIMKRKRWRRRRRRWLRTDPAAGGQVPLSAQVISSSSWQVGHLASGSSGGCMSLHRVAVEREKKGESSSSVLQPWWVSGSGRFSGVSS